MPASIYNTPEEQACHRMASDGAFRDILRPTAIGAGAGAVGGAVLPGVSTVEGAVFGALAGATTKMIQQDSQYRQAFNACMQNTLQWTPEYNQYQKRQGGGTYPQQPQTVLPPVKPNTGGAQMYRGPMLPVR
ncbi:MAG: hypothetical protein R3D66_01945 [Alphaproteobacteria bacterium]